MSSWDWVIKRLWLLFFTHTLLISLESLLLMEAHLNGVRLLRQPKVRPMWPWTEASATMGVSWGPPPGWVLRWCSPGQQLECNIVRNLKSETPSSVMPRFLIHRNCEMVDICSAMPLSLGQFVTAINNQLLSDVILHLNSTTCYNVSFIAVFFPKLGSNQGLFIAFVDYV